MCVWGGGEDDGGGGGHVWTAVPAQLNSHSGRRPQRGTPAVCFCYDS